MVINDIIWNITPIVAKSEISPVPLANFIVDTGSDLVKGILEIEKIQYEENDLFRLTINKVGNEVKFILSPVGKPTERIWWFKCDLPSEEIISGVKENRISFKEKVGYNFTIDNKNQFAIFVFDIPKNNYLSELELSNKEKNRNKWPFTIIIKKVNGEVHIIITSQKTNDSVSFRVSDSNDNDIDYTMNIIRDKILANEEGLFDELSENYKIWWITLIDWD